jgi:phage tail sheath protein FI
MATPTYPGVYVEEVSSGVRPLTLASTSTAAFIGLAEKGDVNKNKAVKVYNFSEYQNLYGGFVDYSFLTHAVYQFFNNGGSQCYIVNISATDPAKTASVTLGADLKISAISPGVWGNDLKVTIIPLPAGTPTQFNLEVYLGANLAPVETFEGLKMSPSILPITDPPQPDPSFVETVIKGHSKYITVKALSTNLPAAVTTPTPLGSTDETKGKNGSADNTAYTNAFPSLNDKDDVSLIATPGRSDVIGDGMSYCANRSLSDCFFIGDLSKEDDTVDEAKTAVGLITPKNSYGAVYLPWLYMTDPTGRSPEPILVPPSGYIAGLYAKTDTQRGVWKAPAGTAAALAGTVGLKTNFTDVQQGNLNPKNINCIRQFSASGIVIWGARTISSDPEWRYIPVRRMSILLRVSIYNGIQWAVFEPNDEELWSQLRLNINAFMMTLYRRGAFQGSSPSQAFFVKCDGETTTQADIDQGIVNVLVGFAPLKPAEFVMVKISQKAGQTA